MHLIIGYIQHANYLKSYNIEYSSGPDGTSSCQLLHVKMKYSSTRPSLHLKAINSWMDIEK